MNDYYYLLLLIFTIIAAMMVLDNNVSIYFTLIFKIWKVNFERLLWMIRFHPRNPITNLIMKWKYDRIAKEFEKEFLKQQSEK